MEGSNDGLRRRHQSKGAGMSGDHNANQKSTKEEREYHRKRGAEILAQIQAAQEPKHKRDISERSVRVTIGMMRTLANNIPISPFHLHAADQMERMLDELLRLRKKHDRQETET
jgi:hypothetical protein